MKVLISADMEGSCGVVSWVHVMPPEYGDGPSSTAEYERARARMTREVNAAIEGAASVLIDATAPGETCFSCTHHTFTYRCGNFYILCA